MQKDQVYVNIVKKLHSYEKNNQIKILFAIESGSRAWGIASANSDYDVRFVYCYDPKEYSKLFPNIENTVKIDKQDIENPFGVRVPFDGVGWDLRKYLKLFYKSNPNAIEWSLSRLFYIKHPFNAELREMSTNFNRYSLFMHYRSMSISNFKNHIKGHQEVALKYYLYVLRGLLNALFIIEFDQLPPMEIISTLETLYDRKIGLDHSIGLLPLKSSISSAVKTLVGVKIENPERTYITPDSILDNFIFKTFEFFNTEALHQNLKSRQGHMNKKEIEIMYQMFLSESKLNNI